LPYYREVLASAWPDLISDVGAPPPKLDPQFLAGMKSTEYGLYGRNTRTTRRRNQVEDTRHLNKSVNSGLKAPKFLSEKARESAKSSLIADDKAGDMSSPVTESEIESKKSEVPVMYRNVEIKYSKFGVDDFDFGYGQWHRYHIINAHNRLQVLQQDSIFRIRDSHLELIRERIVANVTFHALNTKPCSATCGNRLCQ
jgi:PAB-dependent poly(A)-specific ribonuclease subunit 2